MKRVLSREKKRDGYADPGQYSISAKAFPTLATWSMLEYLHEYTKQDQARLDSVLATVSSLPTVLTGDVLAKFITKDGEFPVTANIAGLLSQHSEEVLNSATTCCLDLLAYVLSPCLEEIIKRYKVGNVPVGLLFPIVEYVAFIATFYKKVGPIILYSRLPALILHYYWWLLPYKWACFTHLVYNFSCYAWLGWPGHYCKFHRGNW
jgi:hypothetical protein